MQLFYLVFMHIQREKNKQEYLCLKQGSLKKQQKRYRGMRQHVKQHVSKPVTAHRLIFPTALRKFRPSRNRRSLLTQGTHSLASFISGKSTSHSSSTACRGNHGLLCQFCFQNFKLMASILSSCARSKQFLANGTPATFTGNITQQMYS